MKKLVLVLALLLFCVPVLADTNTIFERDNPKGVGIDFVVYESDTWWAQEVTVEPRWDFENDESQLFFVAKVNLQKLWAPWASGE